MVSWLYFPIFEVIVIISVTYKFSQLASLTQNVEE